MNRRSAIALAIDRRIGRQRTAVLGYVCRHGIPIAVWRSDAVLALIEINARNSDDIRCVVNDVGLVYVGADIPPQWTQTDLWAAPTPGPAPEGGHAFIIGGYDRGMF